jgi:hypothetical protein
MVHGRQAILCRERNDPIASRIEVWVGCHEQRTDLLLEEKSEGSVQSGVVAGFCYEKATTNCPLAPEVQAERSYRAKSAY